MHNDSIYKKLREHLHSLPIGFPETESGVELRILKELFSMEEAQIVLEMSMIPESSSKIHKRLKKTMMSVDDLEEKLHDMAKRGIILAVFKENEIQYSRVQLAIGMYEFQVDRISDELVRLFVEYEKNGFARELHRTKIPQMRTIPIEKSIEKDSTVIPVNKLRTFIENADEIAVANCVCRQTRERIGEPCSQTDLRESCIMLNETVKHYTFMGIARKISKQEAIEILDKVQADGLVIQPGNSQNPDFICCCCRCCCGYLNTMKEFPKPAELGAGHYFARVTSSSCTGCSKCIKKCPMEAIRIDEKLAVIDLDRCIGCGNCVPSCSQDALKLEKKRKLKPLAKNGEDMYASIYFKKTGPWKFLTSGIKMLLGKKV